MVGEFPFEQQTNEVGQFCGPKVSIVAFEVELSGKEVLGRLVQRVPHQGVRRVLRRVFEDVPVRLQVHFADHVLGGEVVLRVSELQITSITLLLRDRGLIGRPSPFLGDAPKLR